MGKKFEKNFRARLKIFWEKTSVFCFKIFHVVKNLFVKEKSFVIKRESLIIKHEINFDYLPENPLDLKHGWEPEAESMRSHIKCTEGNDPKRSKYLIMRTDHANAMDFIKFNELITTICKTVEFIVKNLDEDSEFYVKVKRKKPNTDEETEGWLNIKSPEHIKTYKYHTGIGSGEKLIPTIPILLDDGWLVYKIDIEKEYNSSYPKNEWIFTSLLGFRLRGNIDIRTINLLNESNETILKKPNGTNYIWDAAVTNLEPKLLKSLSFKILSEHDFWKAGIKFYTDYNHDILFVQQHAKEPHFVFHLELGSIKGWCGTSFTIRDEKGTFVNQKELWSYKKPELSIKLDFKEKGRMEYNIDGSHFDYVDFDIHKYNKIVFVAWHETNNFSVSFKDVSYTYNQS